MIQGNWTSVVLELSRRGSDVNSRDRFLRTVLHKAAYEFRLPVIACLTSIPQTDIHIKEPKYVPFNYVILLYLFWLVISKQRCILLVRGILLRGLNYYWKLKPIQMQLIGIQTTIFISFFFSLPLLFPFISLLPFVSFRFVSSPLTFHFH